MVTISDLKVLTEVELKNVIHLCEKLNAVCPSNVSIDFSDTESISKALKPFFSREHTDLIAYVEGLSLDQQHELVALMYCGRDDDSFDALLADARKKKFDPVSRKISEKSGLVPMYLENAFSRK